MLDKTGMKLCQVAIHNEEVETKADHQNRRNLILNRPMILVQEERLFSQRTDREQKSSVQLNPCSNTNHYFSRINKATQQRNPIHLSNQLKDSFIQ